MSISEAPAFFRHRENRTAIDAVGVPQVSPTLVGIDSKGYREVVAHIILTGAAPSATIQVLFYDAIENVWVESSPAIEFVLTSSQSVSFETLGMRFFMRIIAIAGVATRVDIDVAGAGPHPEDFD